MLSNQTKAVIVFILIVFIASFGSVMFYHHIYSRPVDESILKLADESFYMGLQNTAELKRTNDLLRKQSIINFGFLIMDKKQNAELDMFYLRDKIQEIKIKSLEEKVQTLERRHLEVIRAIAILQKRDWSIKERFESSGIPLNESDEWKLPSFKLPTGENSKPHEILENIEKELEKWEK